MAKSFGGHIVGMSTALEAIAAREAGMEILGLSLITNLGSGNLRSSVEPSGGHRRWQRSRARH
jgi:purine nucleoside phosphorylase